MCDVERLVFMALPAATPNLGQPSANHIAGNHNQETSLSSPDQHELSHQHWCLQQWQRVPLIMNNTANHITGNHNQETCLVQININIDVYNNNNCHS